MDNNEKKTSEQEEGEKVGKLSGLAGGIVSGAAIGTSIIPVVGTLAGAIVGGVVGSEVGKKVGGEVGKLSNFLTNSNKTVSAPTEKTDVTAELQKLAKLHKDGVLDDEEFKAAKAQLLNI